jgi:hypothetical protein
MVAFIGHGKDGCMTFVRILKKSGAFFLRIRFFEDIALNISVK